MATLPPWLAPGDAIHCVAPSGPFDAEAFANGVEWLRERYRVEVREDIHEQHGYLAGKDDRRVRELHQALSNREVKAIVAARGGYGSTRLLADIEIERPVWLVGFSDITALHARWHRAGIASVHGTMVAKLGEAPDEIRQQWLATLEGRSFALKAPSILRKGPRIRAPIVGGNLAVLAALCGTGFLPNASGHAVLLEDVGESAYRVDRMLTTLLQNAFFHNVRGVLLGEFHNCPPSQGIDVLEVIVERLSTIGVPLMAGLAIGHNDRNLALPLGEPMMIDFEQGVVERQASGPI